MVWHRAAVCITPLLSNQTSFFFFYIWFGKAALLLQYQLLWERFSGCRMLVLKENSQHLSSFFFFLVRVSLWNCVSDIRNKKGFTHWNHKSHKRLCRSSSDGQRLVFLWSRVLISLWAALNHSQTQTFRVVHKMGTKLFVSCTFYAYFLWNRCHQYCRAECFSQKVVSLQVLHQCCQHAAAAKASSLSARVSKTTLIWI